MSRRWLTADLMPDGCHDPRCKGIAYFPYLWQGGQAHYRCVRNHTWTRDWGHSASDEAPENAGVPQ